MTLQDSINKLIDAKDKVAHVYKSEVTDEHFDNGNLTTMNEAILNLEKAIRALKARSQ